MRKMLPCTFVFLFSILAVDARAIVPTCTEAGIRSAISSLMAGGTVDASGCGSITFTGGPIAFGSSTAPITLILGTGTYKFDNQQGTKDGFEVHGPGSRLLGQGPENTKLTIGSNFAGDVVYAGPLTTADGGFVSGIEVAGLKIDEGGSATVGYGLDIRSVRDPSSFHNLSFWNMSGTAIIISTAPAALVPNALIPQGISLRDIYIQTGTGRLLANTVVVTGNQIYMGSNLKIIGPGSANSNGFAGLYIRPTSTQSADGRYNTFFSGAVAGYTNCMVLTAPAGPNSGAMGNVIGPGNTFENCGTAYEMTGDASHLATNNWAFANAFQNTATHIAVLDYALGNFIQEITDGGQGTITLTSNSMNNTVIAQMANRNDISDFGTSNDAYSTLSSTS